MLFPDPGYSLTPNLPALLGKAFWQILGEGYIAPGTIEWNFWGIKTFVPGANLYQAPVTLKTFHIIPLTTGAQVSVVAVKVDVPDDAPNKLRYTVLIKNEGRKSSGYRLFAASHPITLEGSRDSSDGD